MRDDRFCNSHCPFTRAIGTIGNKWKPIIIDVIGTRTIRFGQMDSHNTTYFKEGANRTAKRAGRRWPVGKIFRFCYFTIPTIADKYRQLC